MTPTPSSKYNNNNKNSEYSNDKWQYNLLARHLYALVQVLIMNENLPFTSEKDAEGLYVIKGDLVD